VVLDTIPYLKEPLIKLKALPVFYLYPLSLVLDPPLEINTAIVFYLLLKLFGKVFIGLIGDNGKPVDISVLNPVRSFGYFFAKSSSVFRQRA